MNHAICSDNHTIITVEQHFFYCVCETGTGGGGGGGGHSIL